MIVISQTCLPSPESARAPVNFYSPIYSHIGTKYSLLSGFSLAASSRLKN